MTAVRSRPSPGRRPRARRSLAVAALASTLLAIVAAGGGCEVAIGDTVPAFACVEGPDVCPAGQVCYRNQCIPSCVSAGCKGGALCNPSTGLCGAGPTTDGGGPDVGVNDSGPDVVDVMDSQTPEDEAAPPMETGPDVTNPCPGTNNAVLCGCSGDSACASKLCVDQLSVGGGLYQAAGSMNFCSQPCCTSADCPATTVCYATGQGGNYCVNPAWIGRMNGSGAGQGGASCTLARDCRSGLCSNSHCADTCCSTGQASAQCAGGDTCLFDNFPGATSIDKNYVALCSSSGGSGTGGSSCSFNSDCESNLCASATMTGSSRCWNACRNSTDCSSSYSCNYVIPPLMTTPAPIVGACFPTQGNLSMNDTCDPSNDMCKGFCDPSTNKCTDLCFGDSDCTVAVPGWRCRDETIAVSGGGSYSVLACGP